MQKIKIEFKKKKTNTSLFRSKRIGFYAFRSSKFYGVIRKT